jgi:hypothetical protein
MAHTRKFAAALLMAAGFGVTCVAPVSAAPLAAGLANSVPLVEPAQIFQRGRPPIYPYVYTPPRRPGGWSTYFGFVPYAKGDFEVQALQRLYPQTNWPPSMRYWTPQSGF